jgi:hypothetical protein
MIVSLKAVVEQHAVGPKSARIPSSRFVAMVLASPPLGCADVPQFLRI